MFIMSPLPEDIEKLFDSHGFKRQYVHVEPGSKRDAQCVLEVVKKNNASWLIADGYWFGPDFQQAVYSERFGLMLIDALGSPQSNHAHILLNANSYAHEKYYALREPGAKLLLGLDYLPLRPEFTSFVPRDRTSTLPLQSVFISLGGSDPDNVTKAVLKVLLISFPELHYTVIIGPGNENLDSLQTIEAGHPDNISLEHVPDNIPELMNQADLAILAGGSTVWEAMHMGLPSILISFADNQIRVCTELNDRGLALYSGHFNGEVPAGLIQDMDKLLANSTLYSTLSNSGNKLIDGKGPDRIMDAMLSSNKPAHFDFGGKAK